MQDARTRWTILVLVASLAGGSILAVVRNRQSPPPVEIMGARRVNPVPSVGPAASAGIPKSVEGPAASNSSAPATVAAAPATQQIYVHVAGAVNHPNIYTLPPDSRVVNAIAIAGGATTQADIDQINLAEKLSDGEKVYIPRKGENGATGVQPGNTIGLGMPTDAGASGAGGGSKLTDPRQGHVNLNTATAAELQRLSGVGPATAQRIIAYRTQNGGFKKPEDLMDVGGIGPKRMARLAPFLTVR